jgi:NTP pyrophosphatase (non-canonical NTP hydrolase)
MKVLDNITNQLIEFRDQRNWKQFHSLKNLACSISIEASELLELFQWSDTPQYELSKPCELSKLQKEVADIFIYLLYFCHDVNIDIEKAIKAKIAINESKYPVMKAKGNSRKYNEL